MILNIDGKDHEIKFGIRFIRKLDKRHSVDYQGLQYGIGVQRTYMGLKQGNPITLVEIIVDATGIDNLRAEDFVESQEDLDWLFDGFLELFEKTSVTKKQIQNFEQNLQENQ